MEKRLKNIIIALVILLAVSFFIVFNTQSSKLSLLREFHEVKVRLTQDKEEIAKKLRVILAEREDLQDRLEFVQKELERIIRDKDELEQKYAVVNNEKTELQEKLEALQTEKATMVSPQPEMGTPIAKAEEAYWAEVLKKNSDLELQVEKLNKKLNDLLVGSKELQTDKSDAELRIAELTQEKRELERKLQYNEKLLSSISTEMVREKNERNKLEKNLAEIIEQNRALRRKVSRLDRQRLAFAERLSKLIQEKERLVSRIEETKVLLGEKTTQMEHIHQEFAGILNKVESDTKEIKSPKESSVELPTIVVSSTPFIEVDKPDGLEGKILAVDTENNFIVIDVGHTDGVSSGMVFDVLRDNNILGKVKVIQLREEICACDIIKTNAPFRIGDTARAVRN